jgi:small subunit ribosomal protein S1
VRNLTAYGVFLELEEGIDGMIHVSDFSWTRKINHPSEILKRGQEVQAVILGVDKQNQRISLGLKQLTNDPWDDIESRYKIGDIIEAKIGKVASFGAFVQLEDEIDGLIHISQISEERVSKVRDVLKVGDSVRTRVIKVDRIERRIGLSIKAADYTIEQLEKEKAALEKMRSTDFLGSMGEAFALAEEEFRPGEGSRISAQAEVASMSEETSEVKEGP